MDSLAGISVTMGVCHLDKCTNVKYGIQANEYLYSLQRHAHNSFQSGCLNQIFGADSVN